MVFADTNLEAAVRAELAQPEGSITREALLAITNLSASSAGIQTLSGLENVTGLQSLLLPKNPLTNIQALASLLNLTVLDLSSCGLSNISVLEHLGLSSVNITTNYIDLNRGTRGRQLIDRWRTTLTRVAFHTQQVAPKIHRISVSGDDVYGYSGELEFDGDPATYYAIESSEDLVNWEQFNFWFGHPNIRTRVIHGAEASIRHQFYRIHVWPLSNPQSNNVASP